MINAFIGVNISPEEAYVDLAGITIIADAICELNGVKEVHGVFGRYDLIASIEVESIEELNDLVTKSIRGIQGIQSTETFIISFSRST